MADLARATAKMSAFIAGQVETLKPPMVGAVGYSNGANILASVMFEAPSLIDRAVLMHPLIPFDPPTQPALAGRRVLMTAGRRDPICPPALTERLAAYLAAQGADVETHWHEGGHEIRPEEVDIVQRFVSELID